MKGSIGLILMAVGVMVSVGCSSVLADTRVVVVPLNTKSNNESNKVKTVTSRTGRVWMDRNLGALRVAGSSSDSLAYGWLYQWGRPADGHESRTSPSEQVVNSFSTGNVPGHGNFIQVLQTPTDWRDPQNNQLWEGVAGINNPCPSGFRLPTAAEWQSEVETWDTQDAAGAYGSSLKIPMAGYRDATADNIFVEGVVGLYWTSTDIGTRAVYLLFDTSNANTDNEFVRAHALSVRCIQG